MTEITLYNDSSSQMAVMALGKAIHWNPKTTLIVSDKESEILLKYDHVKKYDDIASNSGERLKALEAENEALKAKISELETQLNDREALKAKAKELKIDFPKNIKTEDLVKLLEGK